MFYKEIILSNKDTLIIRNATRADAYYIIEYCNIIGGESDYLLFGENEFCYTLEDEELFIERVNEEENELMLIAYLNSEIVGIGQLSPHFNKRLAHNCEIALSVKKKCWHMGIGKALLLELVNFAKSNTNIKNINLSLYKENINAYNLYKKIGFIKVGERKNYFYSKGKYYNQILMEINL